MNKSGLRSACGVLGSAEFWDFRRTGPATSAEAAEAATSKPDWVNANTMADDCLRLVFLDADGFSRAVQIRSRMSDLLAKTCELNETRRRLSGRAKELSDIRKAWSSLADQGWVEAQQEETKAPGAANWKALSLTASSQFRFLLETAVKLDDPLLALCLSSYWAYGSRRQARRMARDKGLDVGQVRHWACLLKDFVHASAADEASPSECEPKERGFVASTADDLDSLSLALDEQANTDNAALGDLSSRLDDAKQRLRKELVRLVFVKNVSPDALGVAASSPWGVEVRVLCEALRSPLSPVNEAPDLERAAQLRPETITEVLSQNELFLSCSRLSHVGGRLAGGNLDRRELWALRRRELTEYLRRTVVELGPKGGDITSQLLPAPDEEAQDARASLDMARRIAVEIVKLRSFVKASLDLEVEAVSKTVESLKLSLGEGVRRSDGGSDDLKELRSAVSSLRRDLTRLGKSVQDEMSPALEADTIKDFLFVIDDLSRIISYADARAAAGVAEALEIVLSRLDGALTRHRIRRIEAIGEQFDPSLHDCVGTRKAPEVQDGAILEEVSRGYTIGDKVLRPAKVIVCG
ncbi:MAG: nucleotide exchange factor GrpE [Candidatus Coatesbacteria bacterium]|nr:nucleotide exchange factor GrpE [Candidatus Coatesbacteria bacterium]